MPPAAFAFDFWGKESEDSEEIDVECLMPNSILIKLTVNREATLQEVKEDLWDEAIKYPLYGLLRDKQWYIFMCTNWQAEHEELVDETRKLCDIKPFLSVLKVVERKGDKAENLLNAKIGLVIGKGLHEFDALKNPEVNEFRWKMRALCEEIAKEREKKGWLDKILYKYPVRLSDSPELPDMLKRKLQDGYLVILVRFENLDTCFTFKVPFHTTPKHLLQQVLAKKANTTGTVEGKVEEHCLKVCGMDEYLFLEKPLSQYKYIQTMISQGANPQLVTIAIETILDKFKSPYCEIDGYFVRPKSTYATMTLGSRKKSSKYVHSWTIKDKFSFQINNVCRLNCGKSEVAVRACLFHGGEALCEAKETKELLISSENEATWEQDLSFDIEVCDLPRMTRLCLVVYEISKNPKSAKNRKTKGAGKQEQFMNGLAWVNTTVYDFRNQLKMGSVTLYMWTYAEDMQNDDLLHPLGTVFSNPNVENCTTLAVTFRKYSDCNVIYPSITHMRDLASKDSTLDAETIRHGSKVYRENCEQIKHICSQDALYQLHEQEKELMWFVRKDCLVHRPSSLSKLLQCLRWNDYKCVSQMISLLKDWPRLPAENALELLDYAYADLEVRKFAISCLQDISDEDLLLYLLQLVQAVKHESYLYSDLVEFLLQRALNNQKIGHFFFWHLRSEMHVPAVSVRFGLILEAYCRGSVEHLKCLKKQVEALGKLKLMNELIKQKSREPREKVRLHMFETLSKSSFRDTLCGLKNPINPSITFSQLKIEHCKFMDSKMKPLWLVFENDDSYGEDTSIIFKNGDDLRQDMLTLQILRIMDKLWKDEGLDLRMNPYTCISTDYKVGLIEVVLNASTIANIQKEKGLFPAASAFKKGSLLSWFQDHNPDERSLNKAIEEFTLSCAGYCVATYVLGIADRHSDNIMVKKNGQLFHIDFGHILGNFKEKFGIRRERVPFVLTNDFVYVITKGQSQKSQEFSRFQSYCENAFKILRRKGSLFISLLAMMLSTGIPELTCEKDLSYLRETLVLDLSEKEALKHFQSKFDEALRNSWKTSVNWLAHNIAKDNN
ncbi:hypothetical protein CHUAL_010223 [Chamberlinius hualienensis]